MELFQPDALFTLVMLVLLQAVLGFDNLLYISIESRKAPADKQVLVRRLGIGLAIALRLVLLFVVMQAISLFQDPFFSFRLGGVTSGAFTFHAAVSLVGGIFIIYTAIKEIWLMISLEHIETQNGGKDRSFAGALFWIVAMNLVFSFDSILSALALTHVFWIMAAAIVISGGLMIWLSDYVAEFLKRNRMYEVLGLFILFIVGILLVSEGGHLAHLEFFGFAVTPMSKTTFYFVIAVLVAVDVTQGRWRKVLARRRAAERSGQGREAPAAIPSGGK